jgi:homoserine dehydrogenase
LRVAVLGFGTVGQSVVRILTERPELAAELLLVAIFNRNVARKRVDWVAPSVTWTDDVATILSARPDVIVETVGGVELPYNWVSAALTQGISVVTANKLLLATHAPELLALAATHGARLRFEAAVAGGVPIIDAVRTGLGGDTFTRVVSILNGTCNYILSRMTGGDSMTSALAEAQRLGFAEADPRSDLDGHDSAAKLAVLVGVAFKRYIRTAEIPTESIRRIDAIDFRYARRLGGTIRQLSMAECDVNGSVRASVGPVLVPESSDYARNTGPQNLVTLTGQFGGNTTFSGQGAGGHPTAVAVVSDLMALSRQEFAGVEGEWIKTSVSAPLVRSYYLRFSVKDQPGILASITAALARHAINVDAVLQESGFPKDHLPFVVTVEPCEATALASAMREIEAEAFHAEPVLVMPVLPGE